MFTVQVPEGAAPGSTIQVQSPFGNMLHLQVPEGAAPGTTFQAIDPAAQPTVIGAPAQQMMGVAPGGDFFNGASKLFVKQEMAAIELCGLEAKQRYRISVPTGDNHEGTPFLYITEESECFERLCCGPNRSLKLKLHGGNSKEFPVIMEMHKPFSCQGCCFLRPSFSVNEGQNPLGQIEDPCRCCLMDQQIFDNTGSLLFTTKGSVCQPGMCCPVCFPVHFEVAKNGTRVGEVSKLQMDFEECCLKTNRFIIDFGSIKDPQERKMLLSSAMLLDLEYFEQQK